MHPRIQAQSSWAEEREDCHANNGIGGHLPKAEFVYRHQFCTHEIAPEKLLSSANRTARVVSASSGGSLAMSSPC